MEQGVHGSFTKQDTALKALLTAEYNETYDSFGNYSELTVVLKLKKTSGTSETFSLQSYVSVDGETYVDPAMHSVTLTTQDTEIFRHTYTIFHRPDGSKTVKIDTQTVSAEYTGGPLIIGVHNQNITLTTIQQTEPVVDPKASSMTASDGVLGETMYFSVVRQNSSYSHTIRYEFGNTAADIVTKSTNTQITWTPPAALADIAPSNTTLTGAYIITTFNGNTQIGSPVRYAAVLRIPDTAEFRPTFDLSDVTVLNTGTAEGWTDAIEGISQAQITVMNDAGRHSSAVTAVLLSAGKNDTVTGRQGTFDVSTAPEMTFTATVYNQRGYSTTKTKKLTGILQYAAPVITSASVRRCDEEGTETGDGEYLKIASTWSYSEVGNNTIVSAKAYCRPTGEAQYTELGNIASGSSVILGGSLSGNQSYDVRLVITDTLGGTDDYMAFVSTKSVSFNIKIPGTGAAFGKYAEHDNMLDIAWNTQIHGNLEAGDTTVTGDIDATGDITTGGDVSATNLHITGETELAGISVSGDVDVSGDLTAASFETDGDISAANGSFSGNVTAPNLLGNVSIGGNVSAGGTLSVSGGATVGGTLTATGKITANNGLGVTGNETVSGDVTVGGDQLVQGGQIVNGIATVNGGQTVKGNLTVSAAAGSSNTGNISATGGISAGGTMTAAGKITAGGGMDVKGGNGLNVTGNSTVSGTSTVTDHATVNGGLSVSGGSGLAVTGNATVSGTSTFTGKVTANGGMDVKGGTGLSVTGNEAVSGNMTVSGYTKLNSGLEENGDVDIQGDVYVRKTVSGATNGNFYVDNFLFTYGNFGVAGYAIFAGAVSFQGTAAEKAATVSELGIVDYITEQGEKTAGTLTWHYRKWRSGKAECWGRFNVTGINITTDTDSNYHVLYYGTKTINFPAGVFTSAPECVQVTAGGSGSSSDPGYNFFGRAASITASSFNALYFNTKSSSNRTIETNVYAIGS